MRTSRHEALTACRHPPIRRPLYIPFVMIVMFISYEQVSWGQMAAATTVVALPRLVVSLMVRKYIVRGPTMAAVR